MPVAGLPDGLDGLRILHLSDFHLGSLSLNGRALEKAVRFAESLDLDLVAVSGDLLTHPRAEPALHAALRRLRARHGVVAVLGNHDVATTRDPFSAAKEIADLRAAGATLLRDEAISYEHGRERIQVLGLDPRTRTSRRSGIQAPVDPQAGLRILLSHYPEPAWMVPPGSFHLALAGHLHGGQICVPTPRGKVGLAHPTPRHLGGVKELRGSTLVISRGIGTTFLPVRFLARPEAAVLVLRAGLSGQDEGVAELVRAVPVG